MEILLVTGDLFKSCQPISSWAWRAHDWPIPDIFVLCLTWRPFDPSVKWMAMSLPKVQVLAECRWFCQDFDFEVGLTGTSHWALATSGLVARRHAVRALLLSLTTPNSSKFLNFPLVILPSTSLTQESTSRSGTYAPLSFSARRYSLFARVVIPSLLFVLFFFFFCSQRLTDDNLVFAESKWVPSNTSKSFRRRSRATSFASFFAFAAGRLVLDTRNRSRTVARRNILWTVGHFWRENLFDDGNSSSGRASSTRETIGSQSARPPLARAHSFTSCF